MTMPPLIFWGLEMAKKGFPKLIAPNHRRMAYTAFWAMAPPGRKNKFQKEQPVIVKEPSLSIHIELFIMKPLPNNKY